MSKTLRISGVALYAIVAVATILEQDPQTPRQSAQVFCFMAQAVLIRDLVTSI
jgi:hypothetical protein